MRPSKVRQRWDEGRPALCTTAHLTDPSVAELVSSLGFDCIWIDLEHHGTSVETASHMMRAARTGQADVMARPGKGEYMRMGRLLEVGAQGILYPRCESAEEAAEVARWARFAPAGERGFDGCNPDNRYGESPPADYIAAANAQTWLAVQIESPAAVERAGAIAAVEGVDLLFFGPADYSILDGRPGEMAGEATRATAERVCEAARAAGKQFGTLCFDLEHARRFIDMGAGLICLGSDITLLRRGLTKMYDELMDLDRPAD